MSDSDRILTIDFHEGRHPGAIGAPEIALFLNHLVEVGKVTASTHKRVVRREPVEFGNVERTQRHEHLPVVFYPIAARELLGRLGIRGGPAVDRVSLVRVCVPERLRTSGRGAVCRWLLHHILYTHVGDDGPFAVICPLDRPPVRHAPPEFRRWPMVPLRLVRSQAVSAPAAR